MTYPELLQSEILKIRSIDDQTADGISALRKQAHDGHLKEALGTIHDRARGRVRRMEDLCVGRGWNELDATSRCVEGVQHEAREEVSGQPPGPITDVLVACIAQRLVHLGIASYETALLLAIEDEGLIRPLSYSLDEVREAEGELEWALRSSFVPAAMAASAPASQGGQKRR